MSTTNKHNRIVFSIYPNAGGFGFVYMENARKLLDYGSVRINPVSNEKVMKRIRRAINYLRPVVVLVQDPKGKFSRTGNRVRRLIKRIAAHALEEKLTLVQYSRDQIRGVFDQFGATTKYEISQVLLTEFKELEQKSPKQRKLWTSEDRNMAIFDALSLAMTWFYLSG